MVERLRIFLSHAAADGEWARVIKAQLSSEVYDIYDETTGPDTDSLEADDAVIRADCMIVLLSPHYAQAGFSRLRQWLARPGTQARTVVFRVADTRLPNGLPPLPFTDLPIDIRSSVLRSVVDQAVQAIRVTAAPLNPGHSRPHSETSVPAMEGAGRGFAPLRVLGLSESERVAVIRADLFDGIRERLNRCSRAVLHGPPGVGKTHLALEYARRRREELQAVEQVGRPKDYELIVFLDASDTLLIKARLAQLARELSLRVNGPSDAHAVRALSEHLRTRGRALMIADAAAGREVLREIPGTGVHLLITTSRPKEWNRDPGELAVPGFTRQQSIRYLREAVPSLSQEEAEEIAAESGDLPRDLWRAAAAMTTARASLKEYRESVDLGSPRSTQASAEPASDATPKRSPIGAALKGLARTDHSALMVAQVLALLAPNPVPRALFATPSYADLPPALADALHSKDGIEACIEPLVKLGLVDADRKTVSLRPHARATITWTMTELDSSQARASAQSMVLAARPDDGRDPAHWPQWALLTPHLRALKPLHSGHEDLRSMANDAIAYLLGFSGAAAALEFATELCDEQGWSAVQLVEPVSRIAMSNLGICLRETGEFERARAVHAVVYEQCVLSRGPQDLEALACAVELARDLRRLERYTDARLLSERTRGIAHRVFGPLHSQTLASTAELASTLFAEGDAQEALRHDQTVLEALGDRLGPGHLDTLTARCAVARDLVGIGQSAKAWPLLDYALSAWEGILDPDHPAAAEVRDLLTRSKLMQEETRHVTVKREERFEFVLLATEWSSGRGGVSTLNRELCIALAREGHRVHCIVSTADRSEVDDAGRKSVDLVLAPKFENDSQDDALAAAVSTLPGGSSPDFIVGHGRVTGVAAYEAAKKFPEAKRLHFLHYSASHSERYDTDGDKGDAGTRAADRDAVQRDLSKDAHRVFAIGPLLHDIYGRDLSDLPCHPVRRFDPGFDPATSTTRQPHTKGRPKLVLIGRMKDKFQKGVDLAAAAVYAALPEADFIVMGAPREQCDELAAWISARARVPADFVDVRPYSKDSGDVRAHLATATLVLMPSRHEGFGLVGLEAVTFGTPILVTEESGLAQLMREELGQDANRCIVPLSGDMAIAIQRLRQSIEKVMYDRDAAFQRAEHIRKTMLEAKPWRDAVAGFLAAL